MAGDWIKWCKGLTRKPEVLAIASQLGISRREAACACMELWEWFDENTTDGYAASVTPALLNESLNCNGLCESLESAGWLTIQKDGISVEHFDRHNSKSAKSRALAAIRNANHRNKPNAASVTEPSPREDKRRVLLAPARAAVDWDKDRGAANAISQDLGRASQKRDRKLILAACAMSQFEPLGFEWLHAALAETKDAKADKPYAFFRTVLASSAEADGVDFKLSIPKIEIPHELLEPARPP